MEYEKSASGSVYLIKSDKGYWLPGGFGYTSNKAEAGRFSVADMASLNLDGCTLSFLLLQLMDHRKQVTRLGIPFRPEHPYETHARLLLL